MIILALRAVIRNTDCLRPLLPLWVLLELAIGVRILERVSDEGFPLQFSAAPAVFAGSTPLFLDIHLFRSFTSKAQLQMFLPPMA